MQAVLKKLVESIGFVETIEIVRKWGGGVFYVPRSVRPCDPLALTLGLASARKLVQHWGGQYLQLPPEKNALVDMRNASIIADYRCGMSLSEIGRVYGLARQSVAHIVRNNEELTAVRQKFATGYPGSE